MLFPCSYPSPLALTAFPPPIPCGSLSLKFDKVILLGTLSEVSIAVKRKHGHSNSYKGEHLIEGAAYSFGDLVHYHHGREHDGWKCGGVRADMVPEKELRILHLHPKAVESELRTGVAWHI